MTDWVLRPLSTHSGVPLYRQIRDQLIELIHSARLAEGASLPSIRELAATSSVSVITVKGAYEELERLGLIVSRQGHGTFVALGAQTAARASMAGSIAEEMRALADKAERLGVAHEEFLRLAAAVRDAWTDVESKENAESEQNKNKRRAHGKK